MIRVLAQNKKAQKQQQRIQRQQRLRAAGGGPQNRVAQRDALLQRNAQVPPPKKKNIKSAKKVQNEKALKKMDRERPISGVSDLENHPAAVRGGAARAKAVAKKRRDEKLSFNSARNTYGYFFVFRLAARAGGAQRKKAQVARLFFPLKKLFFYCIRLDLKSPSLKERKPWLKAPRRRRGRDRSSTCSNRGQQRKGN